MSLEKALKNTSIAVVGLSAMFADARNIEEFWTNIIQSKDSITEVPDSRWAIDDYYDADPNAPDKTYCKRGGFLPEIDFDPMEFGLPPNILEVTDVSQLLSLVAARDAFDDAGYGQNSVKFTKELRERTGVVLGVGGGQKLITPLMSRLQYPVWEKALRTSGVAEKDIPIIVDKIKKAYIGWNENSFPGMLGNVISGRITNRFDLGGLNSVVDAACAASLSAIRMAVSELAEGRCDMMLTGGVDTDNSPFMYMSFSKTPAFSKSGNIRPFDAAADGMLIGEGIGMLVLKRLEDAERDGDRVYALIKGIGASSDGRFKSVYAPRPAGQALAMERAYDDAGFPAATVGLIEGHGTGTGAGDPTEFTSMKMVFGKDNTRKNYIGIGSVKSQIGHAKSAAGAAGIVKAVLALYHKVLPASINVTKPNTKFGIDASPFYISSQTRPWLAEAYPRRAGVSAFGFGGVNLHFALEEHQPQARANDRLHTPFHSIIINAATTNELILACKNLREELFSKNADEAHYQLISNSQKNTIPAENARLGFVSSSMEDTIDKISIFLAANVAQPVWEHPKGIFFRTNHISRSHKIAALFSGQGAQYVGMGTELANAFPPIHQAIADFDRLFTAKNTPALSSYIYPVPVFTEEEKKHQQEQLTKTQFAQPAIGAMSMGLYQTFTKAGFKADMFAGHSFGELTALWAAGVLTDNAYRSLAVARGQAMAQQGSTDAGSMLAVKASTTQIQPLLAQMNGISIANINSGSQLVLGGSTKAVNDAVDFLKTKGFDAVKLPVSAAFHTAFVAHAHAPFAQAIAETAFAMPRSTVYSNTNANAYPNNPAEIKSILSNHILESVDFKTEIENMYAAGARVFVEFGPKSILTNLVKDILKGKEHYAVALNPNPKKNSDEQVRLSNVYLQVLGVPMQNIDVFGREIAKPKPLSKMNVKLSGNNYVSPATQNAYQNALQSDFKIQQGETITVIEKVEVPVVEVVEKVVEKIVVREVPVEKIVEKIIERDAPIASDIPKNNHSNIEEEMNKEVVSLIKETIESFQQQQTKSLEFFERFMAEQNKQSLAVLELLGKCIAPSNTESAITIPTDDFALSAEKVNGNGRTKITNQSADIAKIFVQKEEEVAVLEMPEPKKKTVEDIFFVDKVEVMTAPVAPATNLAAVDTDKITAILMAVVAEKTGYPAEMLELSMDMEADLGIDSIKRVEIFGAITENHPELNNINPQELAELRTLNEIVVYMVAKNGGTKAAIPTASTENIPAAKPAVDTPATNVPAVDTDKITAILMAVVAEKTGYPAEMLELSMDMEADLGIDSIKRVEIFGAITEKHPELNNINPQELAELRTLNEIVVYMVAKNGGTKATIPAVSTENIPAANPVVETPATNVPAVDTDKITAILMAVVAEKTGYPAEMLELSMDMEADLGIDSIKRVEIFGAITEKHPELNNINPQELAELRTLQEIVVYMTEKQKKNAVA